MRLTQNFIRGYFSHVYGYLDTYKRERHRPHLTSLFCERFILGHPPHFGFEGNKREFGVTLFTSEHPLRVTDMYSLLCKRLFKYPASHTCMAWESSESFEKSCNFERKDTGSDRIRAFTGLLLCVFTMGSIHLFRNSRLNEYLWYSSNVFEWITSVGVGAFWETS